MKKNILKVLYFLIICVLYLTMQELAYAADSKEITQAAGKKAIELHGFYPSNISYSSELEKYIDKLDSVSFAWSRIYSGSPETLCVTKGVNKNTDFYYPLDFINPVRYAKSKDKSIQISVFADGQNAEGILPNEGKRSAAVQAILSALKKDVSHGEAIYFDGAVIDFEELRNTDSSGNDILFENRHISDYFNMFLNELKNELDKLGKKLYVAVNPRLNYDGYDYKTIISIADKIIVMAHDYEPGGALRKNEAMQYTGYDSINPIDSLAPIRRVKQALEDIKNSVGDTGKLDKIWLQICFDAAQWKYDIPANRDWGTLDSLTLSKEKRTTPTYQLIKNRIDNTDGKGSGISCGYNNELQSPYIQYLNVADKTHNIIIYEDSRSVNAKIDLVKAYGMGGISIWSLGNIPNYTDTKGKCYHLDVWDSILGSLQKTNQAQSEKGKIIRFSDKKLEGEVRARLSKPTGDIYQSEVNGVYRLKLPQGVLNISDLRSLVNLEYLDGQNLGLRDIKALSCLKNLRVLNLKGNQITDINPLKGLTKIQILSMSGNRISNIDALSGLKELKELYLGENQLSTVKSLAGLTGINSLYLNANKIKDISSLSKLTGIYELNLEGNSITSLKPLIRLNKLIYLNAGNNKLVDISPVKGLKNLESLSLQRNFIKDISSLLGLVELRRLSLNGNQISDIGPISGLTKLTELYLRDNKITSISKLKGLTNLNTLYAGGNKIIDSNMVQSCFKNLTETDLEIK